MHDAENLVDVVLREIIGFLRFKYTGLQLFKQCVSLIDIHIQNFIATAHK